MMYLLTKLFFCLILTLLVGFLLGWLLSRYYGRGQTEFYKNRLALVEKELQELQEEGRTDKLEKEVCDQKYATLSAQWYDLKSQLEHETYTALRYKELLTTERKSGIDERFKLQRDLTHKEIRIGDLGMNLQKTRMQAAQELNLFNARLRLLDTKDTKGDVFEDHLQLEETLKDRELELLDIKDQLKDLENMDSQSTLELKQTAHMYQELQELYAALREQHEIQTEGFAELQDQFDEITQERDALQTHLIDFSDRERSLEPGVQAVSTDHSKLQAELDEAMQQADQCRKHYEETLEELQQQRSHCRSITEHFAGQDKELAASRMECINLKNLLGNKRNPK